MKPTAVPTIFADYPIHLQPKPEKNRPQPKIRILEEKQKLRKVKFVKEVSRQILQEHSYSTAGVDLKQRLKNAELRVKKYQEQIKMLKKTSNSRKKKCCDLKKILTHLKMKGTLCML